MNKRIKAVLSAILDSMAKREISSLCLYQFIKVTPSCLWVFALRRSPTFCDLILRMLRVVARTRLIPEKLLNKLLCEEASLPSQGIVLLAGLFLERGCIEKARGIIQSNLNRHDLSPCIHKNVSVSCLMHEVPTTAGDGDIFQSMLNSNLYASFCQYLKDASILVVGNSPCELGGGKGVAIDQYDVVIRFNNFHLGLDGHGTDYGYKTSIWVHSGVSDVVFDPVVVDAVDYVVFTHELRYLSWNCLPTVAEIYRYAPEKVVFFPGDVLRSIYADVSLLYPSSGIKILKWLALNNLDSDYCGFKLTDQKDGTRKYFFTQKTFKGTSHTWNKEARILSKLDRSLRIGTRRPH